MPDLAIHPVGGTVALKHGLYNGKSKPRADHRTLMPAAMLWGAVAMLLCCLLCDLIARYSVMLPVNTITALLGVPIIIFVVLRNRNRQ